MFIASLSVGIVCAVMSIAYPVYRLKKHLRKMERAKKITEWLYKHYQQKMMDEMRILDRIQFPLLILGLGLIVIGLFRP